jgi:hypothetical protein
MSVCASSDDCKFTCTDRTQYSTSLSLHAGYDRRFRKRGLLQTPISVNQSAEGGTIVVMVTKNIMLVARPPSGVRVRDAAPRLLFSELRVTSGGRELTFEVVQLPQTYGGITFDHKTAL